MKSPADLSQRWARQWENPDLREARLLDDEDWPCRLSIGKPGAALVATRWDTVAHHLKAWRGVKVGTVLWESVAYRATGDAVEIPVAWEISNAADWVAAAATRTVGEEFSALSQILSHVDPVFHTALVRERSLWKTKPLEQVIQAARLAIELSPGCAGGRPLRALPVAGIDSKFFERHRHLIVRLLDLRYDGECGRQGLEVFLNAMREEDHWLLVVEIGKIEATSSLLPFPQMRVRASDLAAADLKVDRLLVVENERCLHLLPRDLPCTLAVFGSGNNLAWLAAPWVRRTRVGYWGDIDTWGLTLLARAREIVAGLTPLLMTREVFDRHPEAAVEEKVRAGELPPGGLDDREEALYRLLISLPRGRLEQEFLAPEIVEFAVRQWSQF